MTEIAFELERRRGEVARHRENSARLAHEYHKLETTGVGFVEFEDVCAFDITFIEEPFVTYGASVDLEGIEELMGLDAGAETPIPLISGVVTEWDQDDRDFYRGAWVAVRIYFPSPDLVPVDAKVLVKHFFTFTGIGLKDVPLDDGD